MNPAFKKLWDEHTRRSDEINASFKLRNVKNSGILGFNDWSNWKKAIERNWNWFNVEYEKIYGHPMKVPAIVPPF